MKYKAFKILGLLASAALASCGGGGSGGAADAVGSDRIQFAQQANSFQAVEGTQNYRVSGTATALTGTIDRTKTGWNISSTSDFSAADVSISNQDCAQAVIQGVNNGSQFRQQETITCSITVSLPTLSSAQAKNLGLTFGVSDASGNAAVRDFSVQVLSSPGRDSSLPQVSLTGTVSGNGSSNSSAISVPGGTAITLSTLADSQFYNISNITYTQVAGPALTISNADCSASSTVNGNTTCQAYFSVPSSTSQNEYIVAVKATDTQGNTNSKSYNITQTTTAGSDVVVSLDRSSTFANPSFVAASSNFNVTCFPDGGVGNKTVRWSVIPLSSTGTIASGQNIALSATTQPTTTVTAPSSADGVTYALLCTATDANGTKSPSASPDFTTASGQNSANTLFFKVSNALSPINLTFSGDPQIKAFVGNPVTLTMLASNTDGSTSSNTDFNFKWNLLSPTGTTATFNGTDTQRIATFTAPTAGTYVIEGCANRKSSGVALNSTCSGEQYKVSATVTVTTASVIAKANLDAASATYQTAGTSFGVNSSGSSVSDGSTINYAWSTTSPDLTIASPTSDKTLITVANSATDGSYLTVTLTVSNTPAGGSSAATATSNLTFKVTNQPNGPATITESAGTDQTIDYTTWSASSTFNLKGSSVITNNESGFTKTVKWYALPDLSSTSYQCVDGNTPVEVASLNPNPRDNESTSVFVQASDQPAQGTNKSYFYLLRGELRDSANNLKSLSCSTTTVTLVGRPADIVASVDQTNQSQMGTTGISAYSFNLSSTTTSTQTLRYYWYDANNAGLSISNPSQQSTTATITDGPNKTASVGLIVYTDSQVAGLPTDFSNSTQRETFVSKYPSQRAFVTISVTSP